MSDTLFKCGSEVEFLTTVCEQIRLNSIIKIEEKGMFTLVLSGGRTPILIFNRLINDYLYSIDWAHVHFFWVDERCVPSNSHESNYGTAERLFFSKVNSIGSINRMKGELDPVKAVSDYDLLLKRFFNGEDIVFDMVLLGMGEDGHVASLFPGDCYDEKAVVVSTTKKYFGHKRISLTESIINKAKVKVLLVNSEKKRQILESKDNKFPINRITHKSITLLEPEDGVRNTKGY